MFWANRPAVSTLTASPFLPVDGLSSLHQTIFAGSTYKLWAFYYKVAHLDVLGLDRLDIRRRYISEMNHRFETGNCLAIRIPQATAKGNRRAPLLAQYDPPLPQPLTAGRLKPQIFNRVPFLKENSAWRRYPAFLVVRRLGRLSSSARSSKVLITTCRLTLRRAAL
jgi:hypothetical protein